MNRSLLVVVLASACVSRPVTAPAPLTFHATKSARDATQTAALALANAGFRVAQSDSIGTALTASRTATHNGNEEYIRCKYPNGSDAAANRETMLFITFRAVPSTSGSDVTIGGTVRTTYPGYQGTAMEVPANNTDCVSNNTIEQQLEAAVR